MWEEAHNPADAFNEDCFWSFNARRYYPKFKIASVTAALDFAFELNPRRCYEMNGGTAPLRLPRMEQVRPLVLGAVLTEIDQPQTL
jgi:hypothetical protein